MMIPPVMVFMLFMPVLVLLLLLALVWSYCYCDIMLVLLTVDMWICIVGIVLAGRDVDGVVW